MATTSSLRAKATPKRSTSVSPGNSNPQPITADDYDSWNPSWAPDSQRLTFASTRDGNAGIYTAAADGSNIVRLTPLDRWAQAPTWAPDGSAIAYITSESGGVWAVYLMQSDGGNAFRLFAPVFPEAPAVWSPDSGMLALTLLEGDRELAVIAGDGSGLRQLTANEANDWGPAWEPP